MTGHIVSTLVLLDLAAHEVAKRNPQRRRITFTYCNAAGSVANVGMILDGDDRDSNFTLGAGGMPLGVAPLVITGEMATHRFSGFTLALGVDNVLGVIEEFDDDVPVRQS